MNQPIPFLLFLTLTFLPARTHLHAQMTTDASVELWSEVQADPPRITLHWKANDLATQHSVHRKLKTAQTWGTALASLPAGATHFVDSTVSMGIGYEYRVIRIAPGVTGYGYIHTGIEVPAIEDRGKLILIVDETFSDALSLEIDRLKSDMEGDGWRVTQHNVSRTASVQHVKSLIVSTYNMDPQQTKAVLLLGRIPVPYSGDLFPDGHPDHQGAWPADVYYADVNGTWTDMSVNVTVANEERHHNVPKDGKFDQTLIPSDVELQLGRVDMSNMPAFALAEEELLRNYLDKDHAYRQKHFVTTPRAVIDDHFGYFNGEAFAASGWKNFAPLVGPDNVIASDYFTTLRDSSYQWSYGCGGGWYQGAGGIGSTQDFAAADLQTVFTILFGSYFGDWDSQNNFLRAPLAQGRTLTNVWSGRPHWVFHHMGLGETIGYSTRVSQNNSTLYFSSYGARFIHLALMGDPTLRQHVVAPASDLIANITATDTELIWTASEDEVLGYHVYRRTNDEEAYTRLTDEPVSTQAFTDSCIREAGTVDYMVRTVALQESPSGSYFNLSQGIMTQVAHPGAPLAIANASWAVSGSEVSFVNFSQHANSFLWVFGDGSSSEEVSPVHHFLDGYFEGYLIASNACHADTFYFTLDIFTNVLDTDFSGVIDIIPNPSTGKTSVRWSSSDVYMQELTVFDLAGRPMLTKAGIINGGELDLTHLPDGMYFLHLIYDGKRVVKRIVLQR